MQKICAYGGVQTSVNEGEEFLWSERSTTKMATLKNSKKIIEIGFYHSKDLDWLQFCKKVIGTSL